MADGRSSGRRRPAARPGAPGGTEQRPATFFADAAQWRRWLELNHDSATELWMELRKKHVEPRGLTWEQAVPEALCFGWIDSVMQSLGPDAVRQRWTPRRPGSTWSAVNLALVERLEAEGRLTEAGRAAFAARRADRQATYAYEQAEVGELPKEYAAQLANSARAQAFWESATPSYRRAAIHWVLSAKQPATRDRRLRQLVDDCSAGRLIPPQRYGTEPAWVTRARQRPAGAAQPGPAAPGYAGRDCERWVAEDPAHQRADRADFARDRARVVHSAALRRLSAKTQVVQPGSDDFVRNRLTHSLEVAQIGREFGAALGCDADVVDTACLSHDLGHPPFGHHGETVLDEIAAPIGGFEGNAQTLRILTRLEPKRVRPDGRPAGLNLTRASLDAATKYPWRRGEGPYETRKFGAYDDDLEVFSWMRGGAAAGDRCLEAEVMDWSDDVAYSVHDVEDAIASGRVDPRVLHSTPEVRVVAELARAAYAPDLQVAQLEEAAQRLVLTGTVPRSFDGSRADLAALKDMTSRLIGRFVYAVEVATRQRHGPGPLTRYAADLVVPDEVRAECSLLKAVAAHYVMLSDERQGLLGRQREVVEGLVQTYRARPDLLDPVLAADHAQAVDDAARLRVVVDQVASLTDARAIGLHAMWCRAR